MGQGAKFITIGALGTGLNFLVYTLSISIGIHYVAASFIGWATALFVVFWLNRSLTFRSEGGLVGDFARTVAVYVGQQFVMVGVLLTAVDFGGLSPQIGFFLGLPIAVMFSFFGLKFFAFRRPCSKLGETSHPSDRAASDN